MKIKKIVPVLAAFAVVVTPVFASAANPESTAITATVNSAISMTGSTTAAFAATPDTGNKQGTGSGTYSVTTNNTTGYNLRIRDSDATLNLVSGANTITPGTGTQASPAVLTAGTWGWSVVGAGGAGQFDTAYTVANNAAPTGLKFAGITATDVQLKSTSTTASADPTTIYYSMLVATTQPTGAYIDTVVITATANP